MLDNQDLEVVRLKKLKLIILTYLNKELQDLLVTAKKSATVELSVFGEDLLDGTILARVKLEIFAEDAGVLTINTPKNWFEHLRADHAPRWLLRRWPVSYRVTTYLARELFPTIPAPGIISRPKFFPYTADPEYPPKISENLPKIEETI